MPKYLVRASLTADGLRGTLKEGGSARRAALEHLAESMGTRLEAFYYAFGEDDIYGIFDAPDNVTAAAASMIVSASGVGRVRTVVLISPEEVDEVSKKHSEYTPPRA